MDHKFMNAFWEKNDYDLKLFANIQRICHKGHPIMQNRRGSNQKNRSESFRSSFCNFLNGEEFNKVPDICTFEFFSIQNCLRCKTANNLSSFRNENHGQLVFCEKCESEIKILKRKLKKVQ